ncbi:hypothetical protein ACTJLC_20345 [Paraburkholderia sp. 22099]|uniref:hypothetical protein n=1 Tax=Paraburkholderia TaxID=1822464 RepID=UPI00285D7D39|nr:hypothetical protein [Paraburkholderia terricola]MDR6494174.1 hypothetical protein [Paraburkholderia terricola]
MPALVDAIWRVRPLAMVLTESETTGALEEASGDYPGDRVAAIMAKKLGHPLEGAATERASAKKNKREK